MKAIAYFLRFIQILVILLVVSPLLMLLWWFFTPKTPLALTVVDKTVLNTEYEEHASLFWWLRNEKRSHPQTNKVFKLATDYYGFYPGKLKKYEIKGLSQLSEEQLDSVVDRSTHLYFTDNYGIFALEWNQSSQETERSGIIYGGLSKADVQAMQRAKEKGKTIITEFNCIGSPTAKAERLAFEKMFGLRWSGWIGRFVDNLDTTQNLEIPRWMKSGYVQQHGHWPFKKGGIVLVNESDQIEILEDSNCLTYPVPIILTSDSMRQHLAVKDSMPYPFWFDIMLNDSLDVWAHYQLQLTPRGDSVMRQWGLPSRFPAILAHTGNDYQFYYFAGDFADNPVQLKRSYLKGIRFFREFFYDPTEPSDRNYFFWEFYLPLLDLLLGDAK